MSLQRLFWLFFWLCSLASGIAQHANEVYGKNKIQYNNSQYDKWMYETNNFVVYWYGKAKNSAQFCISLAEQENHKAKELFEYHLKDKIELIVFADASDLAQSNIDLKLNANNRFAEPRVIDHKILLAFNGNHHDLLKQLQLGIIQIYLNSMFSGSNLQEAVQKVISFKLPTWYADGILSFFREAWTTKHIKALYTEWNPDWSFKKFANRNPVLAGHSFWNFITVVYGKESMSNWLYMTRIQRDVHRAARLVFHKTLKDLERQWQLFYKNAIHNFDDRDYTENKPLCTFKLKEEEKLLDFKPSAHSDHYILTTQRNGQTRVRLLDIKSEKLSDFFKKGTRSHMVTSGLNFPLYTEFEDHQFILVEKRDRLILYHKKTSDRRWSKEKLPRDVQQAYSMVAINKGELLLAANKNGYSDLMTYSLKKRQFVLLTNNIWDEVEVKSHLVGDSIVFYVLSNSPDLKSKIIAMDTTLPLGPYRIYPFQLDNKRNFIYNNQSLLLSSKPDWDVSQHGIILLDGLNGRADIKLVNASMNEFLLSEDSPYSQICFLKGDRAYLGVEKQNNNYRVYKNFLDDHTRRSRKISTPEDNVPSEYIEEPNLPSTNFDTLFFVSKYGNPHNVSQILNEFNDKRKTLRSQHVKDELIQSKPYGVSYIPYVSSQAIAYRDRFAITEISSDLQNNVLFDGLNTFAGSDGIFNIPPLGVLFKGRAQEIFQDINIEAGIRIPTTFNGTEAYLLVEDLKRRIDHKYAIYRRATKHSIPMQNFTDLKLARRTLLLNHQMTYAFSHYFSLRLNSTIRNDHNYYFATNKATLKDSADFFLQKIGTRFEVVYDDVLDRAVNIKNGWQAKLFFEFTKRFEFNASNKFNFALNKNNLLLAGFDVRHHLPVLKKSSWSNRFFSTINLGSDKILFHIGGTENWLLPKYNREDFFQPTENFLYNSIATAVRGHSIGARKNGSFMLFTSELRVPFMQYLLAHNWKNSFLRNFQLIGYVDFATSWEGAIPFADDFQDVQYKVQNKKVSVDLSFGRDANIAGTGLGLRTSLFGYFVRLDYAWKISNSKLINPIYHLSLGLDF